MLAATWYINSILIHIHIIIHITNTLSYLYIIINVELLLLASSNDARNIFLKLLSYYMCVACVVCSSVWRALESPCLSNIQQQQQWVMQFSYSSVHGGAANISHNFSSFTSSATDEDDNDATARVKNHTMR